jgi:excisionase family DNA binding protein
MPVIRDEIVLMRKAGLSLREISQKFGISAERVRQIVTGKNNKKVYPSGIDTPLSTGDVARLLNIHVNTVRRWSHSGLLKTYRVGPRGDRRFRRNDVQKLLEKSSY